MTPAPAAPALAVGQSVKHSWWEAWANVAIGYGVALISQLVVFPFFGIHVPISANIQIGLWFTLISLVRSFALRRAFNALHRKQSTARIARHRAVVGE
jgi:hypothetical protein